MTINYRRATVADCNMLTELRIAFLHDMMNREESQETEALRENIRQYLLRKMPRDEYVCWVAEVNGDMVGTGGMVLWEATPNYRMMNGRKGYIMSIYTRPAYRRQGIAKRIVDELLNEARNLGVDVAHLHAAPAGLNTYLRAGFAPPDEPELKLPL